MYSPVEQRSLLFKLAKSFGAILIIVAVAALVTAAVYYLSARGNADDLVEREEHLISTRRGLNYVAVGAFVALAIGVITTAYSPTSKSQLHQAGVDTTPQTGVDNSKHQLEIFNINWERLKGIGVTPCVVVKEGQPFDVQIYSRLPNGDPCFDLPAPFNLKCDDKFMPASVILGISSLYPDFRFVISDLCVETVKTSLVFNGEITLVPISYDSQFDEAQYATFVKMARDDASKGPPNTVYSKCASCPRKLVDTRRAIRTAWTAMDQRSVGRCSSDAGTDLQRIDYVMDSKSFVVYCPRNNAVQAFYKHVRRIRQEERKATRKSKAIDFYVKKRAVWTVQEIAPYKKETKEPAPYSDAFKELCEDFDIKPE